MAPPLPLPADGYTATWATWDGEHSERLTLEWDNEAWTAIGRVGRERIEYVIRLSPLWQVRQLLLFRDLDDPDLWLGTDGRGHWGEVNGAHRPELDGAVDVDLGCTPFSHALVTRRLPLPTGEAAELTVLAVDVETLAVEPTHVVYARLDDRRWRVTRPADASERAAAGAAGTVHLDVDVDEYGLPIDVAGRFRRTS